MEQYLVIADYKKEARNEVTVYEGQVVDVFEKNASGEYHFNFSIHSSLNKVNLVPAW